MLRWGEFNLMVEKNCGFLMMVVVLLIIVFLGFFLFFLLGGLLEVN